MARRPRQDEPGSWHHVGNRAIAKRPYFESRTEQRYFLSRIATEVRAERLEVHAYCLMTTHFHLLVRSPRGELSEGMRRAQNAYSRYFNRRRKRDGPLIRSRFFSKRITTDRYRRAVVRYIDANPVRAGMVATAAQYEFGSARAYLEDRRPPWLCADWIVPKALEVSGQSQFGATAYLESFGPKQGLSLEAVIELVEARLQSAREIDPLDDLVGRTPMQVQDWLARKAKLADGLPVGLPVCGPATIARAIAHHVAASGDWVVKHGGHAWSGSEVAHVGLLRELASLSLGRVGQLLDLRRAATTRRVELHEALIQRDESYRERVGRVAKAAIDEVS